MFSILEIQIPANFIVFKLLCNKLMVLQYVMQTANQLNALPARRYESSILCCIFLDRTTVSNNVSKVASAARTALVPTIKQAAVDNNLCVTSVM